MPIRFRCAYCSQLLGISRRKAGTVVRCPNCAGQVVVPTLSEAGLDTEEPEAAPRELAGDAGPPPLFEGNELDKLLEGDGGDQPSALPPAKTAQPMPRPTAVPSPAPEPPSGLVPPPGYPTLATVQPPGIFLSPARATMLSVLAVLALAVAFAAGLLVGLFVLAPGR